MIDGPNPLLPVGLTRVATTPSDGRQIVRDAAVEGYEIIKLYSMLDVPTFTAIVDEARKLSRALLFSGKPEAHYGSRRLAITTANLHHSATFFYQRLGDP
jgi:hypothetical protein